MSAERAGRNGPLYICNRCGIVNDLLEGCSLEILMGHLDALIGYRIEVKRLRQRMLDSFTVYLIGESA